MAAHRREMLAGLAATGALSALPGAGARAEAGPSPFAGTWSGILPAGPSDLRLRLDIGADGKAVLTSIDQGNARIPAQVAREDAGSITVLIPTIGASYEAELTASGTLEGQFTQAGQTFPLTMARGEVAQARESQPMSAQRLHALRLELGTPGVAAGWQRGKASATLLVDGSRSVDAEAPIRQADRWHIGSIGKSMTATLAARAVEAGAIGWDSTITTVLGGEIEGIHPGFADVTLLHLLSHRSGLPAAAGEDGLADYPQQRGPDIHQERLRLARAVLTVAPATPMGTAMAYANANYVIVGAMLETLLGEPWEALIEAQLFRPLGLASAGIGLPGRQGRLDQPVGHTIGAGGKRIAHFSDLPAVLGPAGLIHMNLADLLAYLAMHRDRRGRLLGKESWERLHTAPFGGNYALGWVVLPDGALMHDGSNGSWTAIAMFDVQAGIVAAFAGNDAAALPRGGEIIRSLRAGAGAAG